MAKRKILITGAGGMLGHELIQFAPVGAQIIPLDHDKLDVTDPGAVDAACREFEPDQIIHAAAMTDVDGCEKNPDRAYRVNGVAARILASTAARYRIELLFIGSDYVFDGTKQEPYLEHDAVNPQSTYGRSKLWGEEGVRDACDRFWIVRTQWLYGKHGKNFVDTIRKAARERPFLQVVNDQVGCPTWVVDLAKALYRILEQCPPHGVYHCSSNGACSWYDFAKLILELDGIATLVKP